MKGIIWNLARLLKFGGRESRERFWPYAALVILLTFVGSGIGMSVAMSSMFEAVEQVAATHPQDVTVMRGPGSYSVSVTGDHPELMPDFGLAFGVMGVVVAIAAILLAAAVVRRLHDSGRAGWWGAPPLIFLGFGIFAIRRFTGMMTDDVTPPDAEMLPVMGLLFLNNVLYLGSLGLLVLLLCLSGSPGPNRYGERADEGGV